MIFVGGDFAGTRRSFPLADKVPLADIGLALAPLIAAWAMRRAPDEGFGDFCTRLGADGCRAASMQVAAQ